VSTDDHHSAYLSRALTGLTPAGRARIDELLDELVAAAGGHGAVVRFAAARRAEVARSETDVTEPEPAELLTRAELNELIGGFVRIRDQEHLDDVGDWANAVIALLEDAPAAPR
jgi:hypothetical protein